MIEGLTSPPIIPTTRTPEDIAGDWLDAYMLHLKNYKDSGQSWSRYTASAGIGDDVKVEFARIREELHSNGFYDPHIEKKKLVCYTLVRGRKSNMWHVHRKSCRCVRCSSGIFTKEDAKQRRELITTKGDHP